MKAYLKNYRQSPRKVRLVTDLIKGKHVEQALVNLKYVPKRASVIIKNLLESAVSNAKNNFNIEKENLIVKDIRVDEAPVLKRTSPRARGSAYRIKKRSSNVSLVLEEKTFEENKKTRINKTKKAEKADKTSKTN